MVPSPCNLDFITLFLAVNKFIVDSVGCLLPSLLEPFLIPWCRMSKNNEPATSTDLVVADMERNMAVVVKVDMFDATPHR